MWGVRIRSRPLLRCLQSRLSETVLDIDLVLWRDAVRQAADAKHAGTSCDWLGCAHLTEQQVCH